MTTPVDRNAIPHLWFITQTQELQNVDVSAAFPLVVFQQACEFQLFFLTSTMSEIQSHCVSGLSLCNFHCFCY